MKPPDVVDLLTQLLQLQSYDPHASEVPDFIVKYLKEYGIAAKVIESNGIKNIVARTEGQSRLVLNGHWDTVLPKEEWRGKELYFEKSEKYLSGLGACDMKAGVACMIVAFIRCHQQSIPGIVLSLVGDEELGGENGTKVLVEKGFIAPNVILGEPTNLALSQGQKSGFTVEVSFKGTSAHGAYPHRGDNAILKAMKYETHIRKLFPIAEKTIDAESAYHLTTASLNLIKGGTAENVVPADAIVTYDVRFPPTKEDPSIKDEFLKAAEGLNAEVKISGGGKGWMVDKNTTLFSVGCESIQKATNKKPELIYKMGTNDGKYYAPHGCNIINIGPGDNKLSHSFEEKVTIEELMSAVEIYNTIAQNL